jgi:hypothetical protein
MKDWTHYVEWYVDDRDIPMPLDIHKMYWAHAEFTLRAAGCTEFRHERPWLDIDDWVWVFKMVGRRG